MINVIELAFAMIDLRGSMDEVIEELRKILALVENPLEDDWDPFRVGILFAKLEYPDLDIAAQEKIFMTLVEEIAPKISRQASMREQSRVLIEAFSETLGFQGDKQNYYNIKNSFLNDVLLRRKGIPISLSLLFMGIARAVGLKALGISFPGHFLVRMVASAGHFEMSSSIEVAEDWRQSWYVDCFDGGKVLTTKDCEQRLQEWTRGVVPFGPDALKVAHPTEILSRMLRNLRAIFMEKEDFARLYWVQSALIGLCPSDRVEAFRDRGLLFVRMGRFPQAADDFRSFLAESKDIQKRAHVEQMLRLFENRVDSIN